MQAWLWLPGVIDRSKLFATSLRIGVGDSANFALKQKSLAKKLLMSKRYAPDELLKGLLRHLENRVLGIAGFYVFSINQIEATLKWRAEILDRLV
jgi:methylenetetrahydrofolate reductase (NADPH)